MAFCYEDPDPTFKNMYPNGLSTSDLMPYIEALDKKESLQLEWKCRGHLKPSDIMNSNSSKENSQDGNGNSDSNMLDESSDKMINNDLSEFDFDDDIGGNNLPTMSAIRKNPTTSKVRPKRVANMDKILNDIIRKKKEERDETGNKTPSSPHQVNPNPQPVTSITNVPAPSYEMDPGT